MVAMRTIGALLIILLGAMFRAIRRAHVPRMWVFMGSSRAVGGRERSHTKLQRKSPAGVRLTAPYDQHFILRRSCESGRQTLGAPVVSTRGELRLGTSALRPLARDPTS